MLKYPELFTPFKIGKVEIKNRICLSAMDYTGWYDRNGIATDRVIDYFVERAKGGVGLIHSGSNRPNFQFEGGGTNTPSPFMDPKTFVFQYKKLADKLHAYGAKLFIQFGYGGGRVAFPASINGDPVAASAGPNRWDKSIMCRELTKSEIEGIVKASIEAAAICKRTGCDGININAYGGYLLDQFITASINHRTDEYGGSLDGRVKVLVDIIHGIKEVCGKDFPVTCRIGTKQYMKDIGVAAVDGENFEEFGRDVDESIAIAKKLEEAGCDGFFIGNGTYDSFHWLYPPMYQKEGLWLDDVAPLKKAVKVPVFSSGKILQPGMANDAIKNGVIDAVVLGRALVAEPNWANLARSGDVEAIRPCIGCNAGCVGHIFSGLPMQCAVNADLFHEKEAALVPAETPKNVAIIGGGIAGMECARLAAKRGHKVTIYEQSDRLGGTFIAAATLESKGAERRLLKWYEREIKNSGVQVVFNFCPSVEAIERLNADSVVVATGASPKVPPIPGLAQDNVLTAIDALRGFRKVEGSKVTVIGGGHVGCEVALWLKDNGVEDVNLIEAMPELLMAAEPEPIPLANKLMLLDLLEYNKVNIYKYAMVRRVDGDKVILTQNGEEKTLTADTVILAIGFGANNGLYRELIDRLPQPVWCIGDAKTPTNIMFGIRDANAVARLL